MAKSREANARRWPRILVAVALLCVMAGLFGTLTTQLRAATQADVDFVIAERRGVAYLRPLTRLIVELSEAQSVAVRGGTVNPVALGAAAAAVTEADRVHAVALRTEQRWTFLRTEIDKVKAEQPRGTGALERYGDLITLATELGRRVGDTSKLILDPELDTFYLMDTVLLQLPTAITAAGAAADNAHLAPAQSSSGSDATIRTEVAVERHKVASASDAIGTGLRKAMDGTARSALGAKLTEPLDYFRAAVNQLVPPTALRQAETAPDAGALGTAAQLVRETALPLAVAVFDELDALLAGREATLSRDRNYAIALAGAGALVGVVLLWWSVPVRGRVSGDEVGIAASRDDAIHPLDVASVSVQMPAVDARDLLAIEELVHIGRGVRARPKDEAGDAR